MCKNNYYEKNKDIILNKAKEYYINNKDVILNRSKDYQKKYRENKKIIKQQNKDNHIDRF